VLNRTTSPIRSQQRLNAFSSSSKMVFQLGNARKSPGTSLNPHGSPLPGEPCEFLPPDNLTPLCPTALESATEPFYPENTTPLGMAAHDLRHPAAALVTYSELLAEAAGPGARGEQLALIDSIRSVSDFLLRLLDDALELAHAESGAAQLRTAPSIVTDIVAQCVAMSRPLAARKRMRFSFIQQGRPVMVLLDALKMSKVFNNLIENAIQHCQPGARIEVRLSFGEDSVLFFVRDNGPGIDPAHLTTLFTPFQKTRSGSDQSGTGLGLAIAKHTVDLHGGRIWANSEVGKGATFYVSLPAAISLQKKS
jgi:two-component system phosphate regulon sensor histidine kinase PhoR